MEIPKENVEAEILANWLDFSKYRFSAIRNESDGHSFFKGAKRKKEGVRSGIPDFCIILKRGALLFIELKRQRRILKNKKLGASPSNISEEQKNWVKELNEVENVGAEFAYGADEAIRIIEEMEIVE